MKRVLRVCTVCDCEFAGTVRKNAASYCSPACRLKDYYARNPPKPSPARRLVCGWCEREFETRTRGRSKFCPDCSTVAHKASHRMVTRREIFTPGYSVADFSQLDILKRDNWTCGICRKPIDRSLRSPHPKSASVDHIVPLGWGGEHKRGNVRAAHLVCNTTKQDAGSLVALLAAA